MWELDEDIECDGEDSSVLSSKRVSQTELFFFMKKLVSSYRNRCDLRCSNVLIYGTNRE